MRWVAWKGAPPARRRADCIPSEPDASLYSVWLILVERDRQAWFWDGNCPRGREDCKKKKKKKTPTQGGTVLGTRYPTFLTQIYKGVYRASPDLSATSYIGGVNARFATMAAINATTKIITGARNMK